MIRFRYPVRPSLACVRTVPRSSQESASHLDLPSAADDLVTHNCVLCRIPRPALHGAETSQWVYPGLDGKLLYKKTPQGDRIMDFSSAGYMGGGVSLPKVPVEATVKPSAARTRPRRSRP